MEGHFWYVYMLQSTDPPGHWYVGMTEDLTARLQAHNARSVPHTARFAPWELVVGVQFGDGRKAHAFERYLKPGSGHAFAERRFGWARPHDPRLGEKIPWPSPARRRSLST